VSAKWLLWTLALVVGIFAVAMLLALRPSSHAAATAAMPAATWATGVRPAPTFRLRDQDGRPVSLASYRGRAVIVTFIDPLCRNYCPLEAAQLNAAIAAMRATSRPAIVAVSANPYGNTRASLLQDVRKWRLGGEWRWAVGSASQLRQVWSVYHIGVLVTTKTVAGVRVHDVAHTEAAYVIDAKGDERALFVWPYKARSVVQALGSLG
jgi:cytochrome oxidase Cu insertion factor (SCO1/SenC/PrrC family)